MRIENNHFKVKMLSQFFYLFSDASYVPENAEFQLFKNNTHSTNKSKHDELIRYSINFVVY